LSHFARERGGAERCGESGRALDRAQRRFLFDLIAGDERLAGGAGGRGGELGAVGFANTPIATARTTDRRSTAAKKPPGQTFGRPCLRCGDEAARSLSRVCGAIARPAICQSRFNPGIRQKGICALPSLLPVARVVQRTPPVSKESSPVFSLFPLCYLLLEKLFKSLIPLSELPVRAQSPPCFS
jgi:hypothetical protein